MTNQKYNKPYETSHSVREKMVLLLPRNIIPSTQNVSPSENQTEASNKNMQEKETLQSRSVMLSSNGRNQPLSTSPQRGRELLAALQSCIRPCSTHTLSIADQHSQNADTASSRYFRAATAEICSFPYRFSFYRI